MLNVCLLKYDDNENLKDITPNVPKEFCNHIFSDNDVFLDDS